MPEKRHLMAFRWRADDGPLKVGLGSSLPSSTLKNIRCQSWILSDKNFLDPHMNYVRRQFNFNQAGSHLLHACAPVHTYCMHAHIQNILSEGLVREDRNATKNGPPSAHQRNAIVDSGPPLAGLVAL